jgi:hypothetical protein
VQTLNTLLYLCITINICTRCFPVDVFGVLTHRVGPKILGLRNSRDTHIELPRRQRV